MNEINVFEVASRKKYRFPFKGMIGTEDLWDLTMKGLDEVFKNLNKDKKQSSEESLMEENKEDHDLLNKIAIVRYVYNYKQQEQTERILAREKKQRDQQIMNIIAKKENAEMENKSIEELKAMLNK